LALADCDAQLGAIAGRAGLIAEGGANASIAGALLVAEASLGKHIGNILSKLDPPPNEDTNRRVLAVLTHLRGGSRMTW
jgi:hypothetical protein